jgi:prepilin-type N-terminal cleavage/methylation domain-containing protein
MFKNKIKKAFSLVEILIVILIIAVLMAVAIPNLLSSRNSGNDSAAKQLLSKVSTEFKSIGITNESFNSVNTKALACDKIKGIAFVDATATSGKDTGGGCGSSASGSNARTVSMKVSDSDQTLTLAVAGGGNNCWGMKISVTNADIFYGKTLASATQCTAESVSAITNSSPGASEFGFPEAK